MWVSSTGVMRFYFRGMELLQRVVIVVSYTVQDCSRNAIDVVS